MIESFKLPVITPETLTGSIVSFNDKYGGLPLKSCVSQISGYQEGSGTPSPSNVRPLHAWSGANLVACGVNLAEEVFEDGYISSSGSLLPYDKAIRSVNFNPCKPDTTYSCNVPDGMSGYAVCWYDRNKSYISRTINVLNVTSPINAFYFKLSLYNYKDSFPIYSNNVSLNYPSTDTSYHAYNGNTYLFTFGQSIYQGSIDWERGVVTCTYGIVEFDGSSDEIWSSAGTAGTNYRFVYSGFTTNYKDNSNSKSNYLRYSTSTANKFGYYAFVSSNFIVCDSQNSMGGLSAFKTYLSSNPIQVAYELATPIEIPLGGIQLLTQEGQNNIFCDTGDTEVKWLKVN